MAVEELNAEEQAFFKSGGEKEPPAEPQEPAKSEPAPKVEPEAKAAPEATKEPEKKPEDKRPPEGFVPHGAFHAEREERKKLESRLEAERQRIAKMEARFEEIVKASQPKPPAIDQDPVAYFDHQFKQVQPKLEEFEKFKTEQANRDRYAQDQQRFMQAYAGAAQQYEQVQKDFPSAYQFLAQGRIGELMEVGYDFTQAQQLAIEDEMRIVAKAFQDGVNPAERMYALARKRGYAIQAPEGQKSPAEQKLDVIERGQKASPEFSPSSQGKPKLTLAAIADMSDEDFAKLDWEKTVGRLAA